MKELCRLFSRELNPVRVLWAVTYNVLSIGIIYIVFFFVTVIFNSTLEDGKTKIHPAVQRLLYGLTDSKTDFELKLDL